MRSFARGVDGDNEEKKRREGEESEWHGLLK
jgi:hypothetical protein